jgi:nitrogen fixation protein FixH
VRWILGLVVAAVAAVIVATIWVGARTFEGTVVADPYDAAVKFDQARHHAASLGWTMSLDAGALRVATPPLRFGVADRTGAPLAGAGARVRVSRPGTAWQDRTATARDEGGGRFAADLSFPEPGLWDVEVVVTRGSDRLSFERRVQVGR